MGERATLHDPWLQHRRIDTHVKTMSARSSVDILTFWREGPWYGTTNSDGACRFNSFSHWGSSDTAATMKVARDRERPRTPAVMSANMSSSLSP